MDYPDDSDFSGPLEPTGRNSASAVIQRNRSQLSCTRCRTSKSKCDRQIPCSHCLKRGLECIFPAPLPRRKQTSHMQKRLNHLESLIKGAMAVQGPLSPKPETLPVLLSESNLDPGSERGVKDLNSGQVVHGPNGAIYVGGSNWAAILQDIEEIQGYFESEFQEDDFAPYTSLSFNVTSPAGKTELLAILPDRGTIERLVSTYFNSNSPALQVLHKPTFQNQYQSFWADVNSVPIAWLSLLFSILVIASISKITSFETVSVDDKETIRKYRESCIQCLLLSNYTRPGPHTIETLSLCMEADFLLSRDDQVHCFLLIGSTVRLAMRMGFHRDSTKVGGNISPFEAEMRRRRWHHLVQIDTLSSFHIGLPGMTHTVDSDTEYPSNLLEEDFGEHSTEPPIPRPESELTPVSYTIYKSHLCRVAGKIALIANRLTLPPYPEIVALDTQLQAAHSRIPVFFQLSLPIFVTDAPDRVLKRFSLALLYQKSRCLLHRAFMVKGTSNPEYAYSRKVGLESAMELLTYQRMVYEAALPGGTIGRDRWFLSALSMHDFLLAAMIVYMTVTQSLSTSIESMDESPSPRLREMVTALCRSYIIWTQRWINTYEAKKAAEILARMLAKVMEAAEKRLVTDTSMNGEFGGYEGDILGDLLPTEHAIITSLLQPPQTPQLSSGMDTNTGTDTTTSTNTTAPSSSGPSLPLEIAGHGYGDGDANYLPLDGFTDFNNEFDWTLFDVGLRPADTDEQMNFARNAADTTEEFLAMPEFFF